MQQKEPEHTIIGYGRLAKHFLHYFSLLNIAYTHWYRTTNDTRELEELTKTSDIVMILINDDAVEEFIDSNPALKKKTLIHCSGTLTTNKAISIHPLMSFGDNLYSIEEYKKIPFILEKGSVTFKEIFPQLENPHYYIKKENKALYHALCVMSGNFTSILWSKFFNEMSSKLNLAPEIAYPYLESICKNLTTNHKKSLTGPLIRQDKKTIEKNLKSLSGDPFAAIYKAFAKLYIN